MNPQPPVTRVRTAHIVLSRAVGARQTGHYPCPPTDDPYRTVPILRSRNGDDANAVAGQLSEEAIRDFQAEHPDVGFAPVVVVIPALNEEDCIGDVLAAIPAEACGLAIDTIVVDDGSSDSTAEISRAGGAYVASRKHNSGQGAAFRVGYRLAWEHGGRYVVTLDADGQWDPAEIPNVLQPVVDGEADLVLGSRVLGHAETDDIVRHAGVRVFSLLVKVLTGVTVTDTSSGLRAMLTEVAVTARQEEPQYQSSELLLSALSRGYRVTERPIVMRKRLAGESKKGHNALYGARYARVILRTWWRERRSGVPAVPSTETGVSS
jgi:glycosyltransferase involved in cell wall biosynthesis